MNNNKKYPCNENYEKAKKIIEEANKNIKYRYIQGPTGPKGEIGPTGPKGENGPTTIEVGITETLDADSEAMVTNTGTNKDVILNFKIPKGKTGDIGPTGPKGDTGPRGLPGEIGISEVITIDGTETIEPDEEAEVLDDFDRNIHHLTFYIPKGKQGDIGPTGPKGEQGPPGITETIVYGERYLYQHQDLNLTAEVDTIVPLNNDGPALFAAYDTENAIDIKESAFYEIHYYFGATPKQDCTLTVSVRDNDLLLPGSNILTNWKANTASNVCNKIIAGLSQGDVLTLSIRTTNNTTFTFGDNANAVLGIVKIH